MFKEKVEEYWQHKGQKKYLIAIDRRRLSSRSKHSLVNLLFQSCGAIAMDYSGLYMDRWLGGIKYTREEGWHYNYKGFIVRRVVYYHDEYLWSCHKELSKEIGELGVKSIVEAGRYLKLRVPLDGEAKIGKSWEEVH